jgi:hypothetical protein
MHNSAFVDLLLASRYQLDAETRSKPRTFSKAEVQRNSSGTTAGNGNSNS